MKQSRQPVLCTKSMKCTHWNKVGYLFHTQRLCIRQYTCKCTNLLRHYKCLRSDKDCSNTHRYLKPSTNTTANTLSMTHMTNAEKQFITTHSTATKTCCNVTLKNTLNWSLNSEDLNEGGKHFLMRTHFHPNKRNPQSCLEIFACKWTIARLRA